MITKVIFEYDEKVRLWDAFVEGALDEMDARQAFCAVVATARMTTPKVDYNQASLEPDGRYKISIEL